MQILPFNFKFFIQEPAGWSDSITKYDQFAEIMRDSLNKDFSTSVIAIVIAAFVLIVVFVVLYEIYRSNKVRQELMELAWVKFEYFTTQLKLSNSAIALLKDMVRLSNQQDPDSIIKSPLAFENSLSSYYEAKKIDSMLEGKLLEIRDLRRKLGFLPLSREIAFTSTRQFDSGEKCIVQIPEDGKAGSLKGICSILDIEERKWSISRPNGPPIPEKTKARISLTRPGDAEYIFSVQVLKDGKDKLVLSHTDNLSRTQQRNWVRIDVSIPVEVTQLEEGGIGDIFSAKIIDMSGGGFGMALPAKLPNGTKLLLNFELPGQGPVNDLPVKVVRVAGPLGRDASKIVHSVAFEGDLPLIQEQIIHYVFEKQRQDAMVKNG